MKCLAVLPASMFVVFCFLNLWDKMKAVPLCTVPSRPEHGVHKLFCFISGNVVMSGANVVER